MSEVEITVGATQVIERTFTAEEVRAFGQLSGDRGIQHEVADAQGRLMVHGLLLASLPTQVGGQFNFLARVLHFEFFRPAWTSVPVRCEATITKLEPTSRGTRMESQWVCRDPAGEILMQGTAQGLIPARDGRGPGTAPGPQ